MEESNETKVAIVALVIALLAIGIGVVAARSNGRSDNIGDNYVERIIAGDNITISPENGYGIVTINSTGIGGNGVFGDNNVIKIIAGDNIIISPENGFGEVTIIATGYDNTQNVQRIIAGENIIISPENGYGAVTITAPMPVPAWTLISDITLVSDNTSVNFYGLDMIGEGPYLLTFFNRWGVGGLDMYLFFNGDETQSHYWIQRLQIAGSGLAAQRVNVTRILSGQNNASAFCVTRFMQITAGFPRWVSQAIEDSGAALEREEWYGHRDDSTNVTSITIKSSAAGGIKAGSRFILMRVT